jgi:hypothetical protein
MVADLALVDEKVSSFIVQHDYLQSGPETSINAMTQQKNSFKISFENVLEDQLKHFSFQRL